MGTQIIGKFRYQRLHERTAAKLEILLKKSICQSVAKFLSNSLALVGILIQAPASKDAIVSIQRNKMKRSDFFNRILDGPDDLLLKAGSQ
jgi:hypothetical protein